MFELSVALKYLLPRRRQLSVSIISLISVFVIALVVWLVLVFFSVTNGLEKIWIDKMVSLTAPVRVIPTDDYYRSYYYQIDAISTNSHYTPKTIGEKKVSLKSDPFNPEVDEEIPVSFPLPDRNPDGSLIDLVAVVFNAIDDLKGVKGLIANDYEMTYVNLKLRLSNDASLSQTAYLGSLDARNPSFKNTLLPLESNELALVSKETLKEQVRSFHHKENDHYILPSDSYLGDGLLLPKSFHDAGVVIGNRGFLSYLSPTTTTIQEQRIPIFVAGFYDPGIMPMGGKFLLASPKLTSTIRSANNQEDTTLSNGINIRFDDLNQADVVKLKLQQAFDQAGVSRFWKIETYREFDFTKDLIQELSSQKNIFSLIAAVMIIVACSNIISMLIILVNDKKMEIGILRSMGATSGSIATIFGLCGMIMGIVGSLIGIVMSLITLRHLQSLLDFISTLQGHEALNPMFYGNTIPNHLSGEALSLVLIATIVVSLLSGIVPAVKASLMRPSSILRSE